MLYGFYQKYREIIFICILYTALRLSTILFMLAGPGAGNNFGILGDFPYYMQIGELSSRGLYPVISYWMEYPPIFPWLVTGVYKLSLLLPAIHASGSEQSWFALLLGVVLLPFAVGNLVLLYALASQLYTGERQEGEPASPPLRVAVWYALLFIPLLIGQSYFDEFMIFWLLLGIWAVTQRNPILAGIATGTGFMIKLVPVVLVPAALRYLDSWQKRILLLAVTAICILVIAAPFLSRNPQFLLASFLVNGTRGPWETIWALMEGYRGFGTVAPLESRTSLQSLSEGGQASRLPWPVITLVFGAGWLWLYTRRAEWRKTGKLTGFIALTLVLLMLYNRGYSPQFLIWLLPFIVLLLPNGVGLFYALSLSMINLVEWRIHGLVTSGLSSILIFTIITRTVLFTGLGIEFASQVYDLTAWTQTWRRRLILPAIIVTILLCIAAIKFLPAG